MKSTRFISAFAVLSIAFACGLAQLRPAIAPTPAVRRGAPAVEPKYARLVTEGELRILESGTTISRHKIVASMGRPVIGPDGVVKIEKADARGLTIAGTDPAKPLTGVTVQDCMVQGDGDDALSVSGNCRRIKILRSWVIGRNQWPDRHDFSKVNKCLLLEGLNYYPDWLTVEECTFGGGFRCPLITGGVFRLDRSCFGPSRRNVWTKPKGDTVDCDWIVQIGMKTGPGENNWSDTANGFVRPICVAEPMPDSLYFSGNTLTVLDAAGKVIRSGPATGNDLCRLYTQPNMVGVDLDVPTATFRARPNR